jgi:hypothetical protein
MLDCRRRRHRPQKLPSVRELGYKGTRGSTNTARDNSGPCELAEGGLVRRVEPLASRPERAVEVLFLVAVIGLVIAGLIYSHYQKQKRIEALRTLAARHGWSFSPGNDSALESRFPGYSCLAQGSRRYAYNILHGRSGEHGFCGFDYHYETYSTDSKGKRTTHHHYFSAVAIATDLPLKPLLIRPETFFDKVGEFFGLDDIDFESHDFSRQFYVKADDRRWAFDVIRRRWSSCWRPRGSRFSLPDLE